MERSSPSQDRVKKGRQWEKSDRQRNSTCKCPVLGDNREGKVGEGRELRLKSLGRLGAL